MLRMFGLSMIFGYVDAQMIGSQRDSHGCSLDGGYQWCETTQKCQRSWSEPCPALSSLDSSDSSYSSYSSERCHIGYCEDPNDCPTCEEGYECKSESMVCAGTCYGKCVKTESKKSTTESDTGIPVNCVSWYDGCNTCQVREGTIVGCTRMMCFRKGESHCLAYSDNH